MSAKHRALIIGAGRIGAGFKWIETPYTYTHAGAYLALRDRVELVGFVEPDEERATAAETKWKLPVYSKLSSALIEHQRIDIVSICTPPEVRARLLDTLIENTNVSGIWCEKPFMMKEWYRLQPPYIQVGYMRRFDTAHIGLKNIRKGHLTVWAKKDLATVPHFTDLARFWGLEKDQLTYHHVDGPNSYEWEYQTATPLNPNTKIRFEGGGLSDGFFEGLLHNLLDAVDGKANLISPPESAIESEKWANEILEAK